MRILEAIMCCRAVANYMREKDDSPCAGQDLDEVADLVQDLQQQVKAMREAGIKKAIDIAENLRTDDNRAFVLNELIEELEKELSDGR